MEKELERSKNKPKGFRELGKVSCKTCKKWVKVGYEPGGAVFDGCDVFGCAIYEYMQDGIIGLPQDWVCDEWEKSE